MNDVIKESDVSFGFGTLKLSYKMSANKQEERSSLGIILAKYLLNLRVLVPEERF
jgi:hypothetical protein